MDTINSSREISAPLEKIWNVISDVDNDSKFWSNLNSINNIRKNGNTVEREVTVGFRNSKGRQIVTLNPKNSIVIKLTEGPLIGTKVTELLPIDNNKTKIEVSWNIEKMNVPFIAKSFLEKQIRHGTEEALDKIAKEVE